jgi:hypothetical protein
MSLLLGTARNNFTLAPTGQEFIIELDAQYGSGSTWTDNSGSGLDATLTSTTVTGSSTTKYVPEVLDIPVPPVIEACALASV